MTEAVHIGPLMLATDRLAAIAAIWLFLAAGTWIAHRTGAGAARAAWLALGAGVVAARFAYVAENWEAYAIEPASALYLWQGGFSPLYGIAAAAIALLLALRGRALQLSLASLAILSVSWAGIDAFTSRSQGRPFPSAVAATTLEGAGFDLASLSGRPFVVNLWATWCPPCLREMPMLVQTAQANPDVPILLVNQGENASQVRAYLRRTGLSSENILLDEQLTFAEATGGGALPTTIFVDANGRIRRTHAGEISRAALLSQIREMKENP